MYKGVKQSFRLFSILNISISFYVLFVTICFVESQLDYLTKKNTVQFKNAVH